MHFELYALRFEFRARDSVFFPAGKPGNVLRGAFGMALKQLACVPGCVDARTCPVRATCAYARIFEPAPSGAGPSGLGDPPRPFIVRARHLDGRMVPAGARFHVDFHVFDVRHPSIEDYAGALSLLAREGLGPRRGRAVLERMSALDAEGAQCASLAPLRLSLAPRHPAPARIGVRFLSPTELKSGERVADRPEFPVLFGRVRDRLSTLGALYGSGPLALDFNAIGRRAEAVRMTRCDIAHVDSERRSSRTGAVHPLGGFVGEAEYEGALGEFVPYLEAARWCGVGRQTVWGKGEIALTP